MDPILQKFRNKFIDEAHGLLDRLEKDILELENKPGEKEFIDSAFRAMHTLKGISSMYGFNFISEFTHHLESIWQNHRENEIPVSKEVSELTFNAIDHIRMLLSDEKLENSENQSRHKFLMEKVTKFNTSFIPEKQSLPENPNDKKKEESTWHIILRITEKIFFRGISLKNIIGELASLGTFKISKIDNLSDDETDLWSIIYISEASEAEIREIFMFIEDDCTIINIIKGNILTAFENKSLLSEKKEKTLLDLCEVPTDSKSHTEEIKKQDDTSIQINKSTFSRISVDASKLDDLMFLVSELITLNSQMNLVKQNGSMEQMEPCIEKMDGLSKQFRNSALELRLVPLNDIVLRFKRLIRDLSTQLGKKIEFKTSGTETELDKSTIDQLAEPLMHIIRNCIDHGIETPDERIKKGKPEQGTISLKAYNSGNYVIISISDDGNGIDCEKVKQKAVDKGILKSTDNPHEKDIFDLIFLPGFSTAQSLTSVSGRGVGMDVVKKRITDLRGEVIVSSEKGAGTTFTLKIQQSLSIIDSLLFSVDDTFFTVPLSEIDLCIHVPLSEIENHRNTSTIRYNDEMIPYIDLRKLFHINGCFNEITKAIVIKNDRKEVALLTDQIIGEHQAVLKPLGRAFRGQAFINSVSQMGDGSMAYMIDTNSLMKMEHC